eukprot:TRINITY_DN1058_c1_g1_i1.p1 TRINITY_DN1058_c1_g1~~TRINITY_DN1058_c1_g1_i1.p1  ORF type:complete len:389 (-),score=91.90 TRINITY_DN1058_c1_g1_i1:140-1306(-)
MSNGEYFNNGFASSANKPFHLHPSQFVREVAAGGNYNNAQVSHFDSSGDCDEEEVQICYDFTKNQCNRGDKCKYSHDIATIIKYNSKEKGICFDFLRGQCLRGMLCKFSHDLSNIAHLYQQASFAPGNNTSTSICYNFLKGVCRDGNTCRYSHDIRVVTTVQRSQSTPVPTQLSAPAPPSVAASGLNASDAALALLQLLQGGSGTSPPVSPITPRHQPTPSLDQLLAQQQLLGGLMSEPVPRLPVVSAAANSAGMMELQQSKDYLNSPTDVLSSGWGVGQEMQTTQDLRELQNLVSSIRSFQAVQDGGSMSGCSQMPVSNNCVGGEIDDMLAQIQALQMSSANSMQLNRTGSGSVQPQQQAMRSNRSMSMGVPPSSPSSHNKWPTNNQ